MFLWLTVWLSLSVALVGFLAMINVVAYYRELAAEGVPNPLLVTYRQTLCRLMPARTEPISDLVGRSALLSWDIRWVMAGRTVAKVTGVDPKARELILYLSKPIHLFATESAPEVLLEEVRFQPKGSHGEIAYGKRAVSGRLLPSLMKGLYATASIVVYPKSA